MHRVLIVDDDETMRRLIRLNLEDRCEVLDTGAPEDALALALQHKPDAMERNGLSQLRLQVYRTNRKLGVQLRYRTLAAMVVPSYVPL